MGVDPHEAVLAEISEDHAEEEGGTMECIVELARLFLDVDMRNCQSCSSKKRKETENPPKETAEKLGRACCFLDDSR